MTHMEDEWIFEQSCGSASKGRAICWERRYKWTPILTMSSIAETLMIHCHCTSPCVFQRNKGISPLFLMFKAEKLFLVVLTVRTHSTLQETIGAWKRGAVNE